MIFEDAHWIDPTTQDVLDLLVPRLADLRVLLVLTYRPEYEPPWSPRLAHLTALNLNRLGKRNASAMAEKVTGGKPLPDEVLDQIVAKTDGVPLFVEELTKMVIESGIVRENEEAYELTAPLTEFAIPSTIQDSLMARLDRHSPVKEIAQTGACIGRQFSYELLAAVSPLPDNELQNTLQQLVNSSSPRSPTDGGGRKREVVGDEDQRLAGLGVLEADAPQKFGVILTGVEAVQGDLVANDAGRAIRRRRIDAMSIDVRLGTRDEEGPGLVNT